MEDKGKSGGKKGARRKSSSPRKTSARASKPERTAPPEGEGGGPNEVHWDELEQADLRQLAALPEMAEKEEAPAEFPAEFIGFSINGRQYAFGVDDVQEVLKSQALTYVPRAGGHVLGITSLRGRIIPVVDLGILVSGKGYDFRPGGWKILILKSAEEPLGVVVDRKLDMLAVPRESVKDVSHAVDASVRRIMSGVIERDRMFISILNANEIFSIKARGEAR